MTKFDHLNLKAPSKAAFPSLSESEAHELTRPVSDGHTVPSVQLPDLTAPDFNGFLHDHGIDLGQDGPFGGELGNLGMGSNPGGGGTTGSIPGISGIPDFGGDPSDGSSGSAPIPGIPGDPGSSGSNGDGWLGSSLPDGFGNGSHNDGPNVSLPGNGSFDGGHYGISGPGVPSELDGGGIRGPAVPGGKGSIGVGGFSASDFDNSQMIDSPHDRGGHSAVHGTASGDGVSTDTHTGGSSDSNVYGDSHSGGEVSSNPLTPESSVWTAALDQSAAVLNQASTGVLGFIGFVAAGASAAGVTGIYAFGSPFNAPEVVTSFVDAAASNVPAPDPDKPDPNKGNQPVDDSGSGHPGTHSAEQPVDDNGSGGGGGGGFHPSTHSAEQPVDDSGTGSGGFHPLTNSTAQPVDDSGSATGHPGTHIAVNASLVATASGHSASFWDAAAAVVASAASPVASTSAPDAHGVSMGIFEHSALAPASAASSSFAKDDHANMDTVTVSHVDAQADTSLSHHFELNLDVSHLSAHGV